MDDNERPRKKLGHSTELTEVNRQHGWQWVTQEETRRQHWTTEVNRQHGWRWVTQEETRRQHWTYRSKQGNMNDNEWPRKKLGDNTEHTHSTQDSNWQSNSRWHTTHKAAVLNSTQVAKTVKNTHISSDPVSSYDMTTWQNFQTNSLCQLFRFKTDPLNQLYPRALHVHTQTSKMSKARKIVTRQLQCCEAVCKTAVQNSCRRLAMC